MWQTWGMSEWVFVVVMGGFPNDNIEQVGPETG